MYSNIEGIEKEIFIESHDVKILFSKMFEYLDKMVNVAVAQMRRQLDDLFHAISNTSETKFLTKENYKRLKMLEDYYDLVPILGFIQENMISRKFKLEDFVRISKVKSRFEKGYTNRRSKEAFKLKKLIKPLILLCMN